PRYSRTRSEPGLADPRRLRRRRRSFDHRDGASSAYDRIGNPPDGWGKGVQAVLARSALQLRRRKPLRTRDARQDRSQRGGVAVKTRSRIGPRDLREYQPGSDGWRSQIGRSRTGAVPESETSPQRRDAARFAFVYGPDPLGVASQREPDGPSRQRTSERVRRGDRGKHANVRSDARLPAQERRQVHGLGSVAAQRASMGARQHEQRLSPPGHVPVLVALWHDGSMGRRD